MSDRLRQAIPALRRWAGYFFQPCPYGLRTIAGAALAAIIASCLLLIFYLAAQGSRQTIALLPHNLASSLETLAVILTPKFRPLQPVASWQRHHFAEPQAPAASSWPDASFPLDMPDIQASPFLFKSIPDVPAPPAQALPPDQPEQYRSGANTFVRAPLRTDTLPYLDLPGIPLSEIVKQVDYALTQTMLRLNLDWGTFRLVSYERRQADTVKNQMEKPQTDIRGSYPLQRLRVYLPLAEGNTPETFTATLGKMLTIWSERASLHKVDELHLIIRVDGMISHELFLSPKPGSITTSLPPDAPLLTIVIDDMGASLEAAQRLLDLSVPITLSIWPRAVYTSQIANMAWNAGQEILIHQPAEPLDFPAMQPGPGTLFTRMSRTEIATLFRDSVSRVPHAVGVNNHMGSRFTMDKASVEALCAAAAEQGLFVLDSLTHPRSLLAQQAVLQGIAAYRRAVFLDDPLSRDAIQNALGEAEQLAHRHGQAIAIGHPHKETLDMLQEWLRTRDTSIRLVPLHAQRPLF